MTYIDQIFHGYEGQFLDGLLLTITMSACSYCLGLVFGLFGMMAKLSKNRLARRVAQLYTVTVRALPELLVLLIAFYVLAAKFAVIANLIGLVPADFSFDPFLVAAVSLGFIQGAYITEILRTGVLSIPRGQFEAASALSLPFHIRWRLVIAPQALRQALPSLGNIWLNATKDSSLISVVGSFSDVLKVSSLAAAATKSYVLFYGLAALCFLVISLISMLLLWMLQSRLQIAGHR